MEGDEEELRQSRELERDNRKKEVVDCPTAIAESVLRLISCFSPGRAEDWTVATMPPDRLRRGLRGVLPAAHGRGPASAQRLRVRSLGMSHSCDFTRPRFQLSSPLTARVVVLFLKGHGREVLIFRLKSDTCGGGCGEQDIAGDHRDAGDRSPYL